MSEYDTSIHEYEILFRAGGAFTISNVHQHPAASMNVDPFALQSGNFYVELCLRRERKIDIHLQIIFSNMP